jgi:hypothetical protein
MQCTKDQPFIASLVLSCGFFSIVGCGDRSTEEIDEIESLRQQIRVIYSHSVSSPEQDGNDEQGPDIDHAKDQCNKAFPTSSLKYSACINMMAAKYFSSSNLSFTFTGTVIYFSDENGKKLGASRTLTEAIGTSSRQRTFEAIWGKDGAVCLSNPRWKEAYQKFKPASTDIRDCAVDPKVPNVPWIGQPFTGEGLLITYYYNQQKRLITAKAGNQVITAPESFLKGAYASYELSSELLVFSETEKPLKFLQLKMEPCSGTTLCSLSIPGISELEEDDNTRMLSVWECCNRSSCSSVTTTGDLNDSYAKTVRGIGAEYICTVKSLNIGYIYQEAKPDTEALRTFRGDISGRFVTVAGPISLLGLTESFSYKYTEGYVYPIKVNYITSASPAPATPPVATSCCKKFCDELLPSYCNVPGRVDTCLPCKNRPLSL